MKKFLFSVCAVLAFFGCGGDTNDLPPFPFGPEEYYYYSSSSDWGSFPSSSSYGGFNGGGYNGSYGSVAYGGRTYRTVRIGSQTWMAENLNYDPGTGNSACYNNQSSYCDTYGRLYDWATAMALPSSCNSSYCSSQIQYMHRGICPSGWHIPSDDDWDVLMDYVGGELAGMYLKATSGWNGTNRFGFSALPGGLGYSGSFDYVGYYGIWWGASEYEYYSYGDEYYSDGACNRFMDYDDYAGRYDNRKSNLFSVRCLQDYSSSSFIPISSSSAPSSSSSKPSSSSVAVSSSSSFTSNGGSLWGPNTVDFPYLQVRVPDAVECWANYPYSANSNCYNTTGGRWFGYGYEGGKAEVRIKGQFVEFVDGVSLTTADGTSSLIDANGLTVRLTAQSESGGYIYGGAGIGFNFGEPRTKTQNISSKGGYCITYSSNGPILFKLIHKEDTYFECSFEVTLPTSSSPRVEILPFGFFGMPFEHCKSIVNKQTALEQAVGITLDIQSTNSLTPTVAVFTLHQLGWLNDGCKVL